MKILITGVAGLLGSKFALWLLDNIAGVTVIGIDNLSGGFLKNVDSRIIFYNEDLATSNLDIIFNNHKPDLVYHFAAYAAEGLSPFIRKFNYTNNLISTVSVINQCIKYNISRLIFTSSMSVYGNGSPPFDEINSRNPIDPYGVAKYACEMDIEIAGRQHGLDWCIIRPHNVYGDNQNIWDSYRNVIGIWIYKKLNNLPISIYGDGTQQRAFTYIDDIMKPLYIAGTSSNASKEIINLGGTTPYTINDVATKLCEITGKSDIEYLPKRHEVHLAYTTWKKSVDLLAYNDVTSLDQGISKMWEWAIRQDDRPRSVWGNYELDKDIYSFWEKSELTSKSKTVRIM
jgi:UDP-glucose 4-epimerase